MLKEQAKQQGWTREQTIEHAKQQGWVIQ
jgi:hypothetical protein